MPTNINVDTALQSSSYCILDANSFYNYFTEVCHFRHKMDGIYTRYHVNPELGDGYMDQVRFPSGLEFCITSLRLKHSVSLRYHLKDAPLEMHYMLDGNVFHWEKSASDMNLSEGCMSVFFCGDMEGTMTLVAGRKITFVTIMVADELLENLLGSCQYEGNIPKARQSSFLNDLLRPHRPTAEIKAIFGQIISCSLSQVGKSAFLQGKAAELVAYIWEQGTASQTNYDLVSLYPYEITALEQAKEMIESNLIEPVSIETLATIVGLNTQKFKKGFKQLYQTTPHQYLIRCRMMQAQMFMCEKGYSVTEAAIAVGYTNVSYFSRVFRQHYGQSPKCFRFGL